MLIYLSLKKTKVEKYRDSYMVGGFADYWFRFVHEIGPLTPVKGYRASCLKMRKIIILKKTKHESR